MLEILGVDRSHGGVWKSTHRLADSESDLSTVEPSLVAVDETAVQIGTEWYWVYALIYLDSLYLLYIEVFSHHTADPAAAFLHKLSENHDVADPNLSSMHTAIGLPCLE